MTWPQLPSPDDTDVSDTYNYTVAQPETTQNVSVYGNSSEQHDDTNSSCECSDSSITECPKMDHKTSITLTFTDIKWVEFIVEYLVGTLTNEPAKKLLNELIVHIEPHRKRFFPYTKNGQPWNHGPGWWMRNPFDIPWSKSPKRCNADRKLCLTNKTRPLLTAP